MHGASHVDVCFFCRWQVWSAEEEYLIMHVTLNAIAILRRWVQRYDGCITVLR